MSLDIQDNGKYIKTTWSEPSGFYLFYRKGRIFFLTGLHIN